MFCRKCGNELPDGAKFCSKCGEQVRVAQQTPPPVRQAPTGQQTPPPVRQAPTGQQTPPPVRQAPTGQQTPPPVRQAPTGQQMPPSVQQIVQGGQMPPKKKSKLPVMLAGCIGGGILVGGIIIFALFAMGILGTDSDEKESVETAAVATAFPTSAPTPAVTPTSEPRAATEEPVVTEEPEGGDSPVAGAEDAESASFADTPSGAFDKYITVFTNAMNTGDFTGWDDAMKEGSAIYNQQEAVAESLYEKGVRETIINYSIQSTEVISDTVVRLTSQEEIRVDYVDGDSKLIQQSYRYICEDDGNGWRFTQMDENPDAAGSNHSENEDKEEPADLKDEYILPDSNTRYYTKKEIARLSAHKLYLARNEIFARHGYKFKTKELQDYFKSKSWYKAKKKDVPESELNACEKANLKKIQKRENNLKR